MIEQVVVYKVIEMIQLKHLYLVYHISKRLPRFSPRLKFTKLIQKGKGNNL